MPNSRPASSPARDSGTTLATTSQFPARADPESTTIALRSTKPIALATSSGPGRASRSRSEWVIIRLATPRDAIEPGERIGVVDQAGRTAQGPPELVHARAASGIRASCGQRRTPLRSGPTPSCTTSRHRAWVVVHRATDPRRSPGQPDRTLACSARRRPPSSEPPHSSPRVHRNCWVAASYSGIETAPEPPRAPVGPGSCKAASTCGTTGSAVRVATSSTRSGQNHLLPVGERLDPAGPGCTGRAAGSAAGREPRSCPAPRARLCGSSGLSRSSPRPTRITCPPETLHEPRVLPLGVAEHHRSHPGRDHAQDLALGEGGLAGARAGRAGTSRCSSSARRPATRTGRRGLAHPRPDE